MQYLSRTAAADYLTNLGIPVAKSTLQKYATIGGGPGFQKFGNRALYTKEALLEWANAKLSEPKRSTSDQGGRQ